MNIIFPDECRKYMELQCNNDMSMYENCPEIGPVGSMLEELNPKNVLELGAGLGRVSVFLKNRYKWRSTNFYLLDGDSGDKQIAGMNTIVGDNFYNSFESTKAFCLANGIDKKRLFLLGVRDLLDTKDRFDLCYSFKAIGFHWPINWYLDEIYENLLSGALLIFEIRSTKRSVYGTDTRWRRAERYVKHQIGNVDMKRYKIVMFNATQEQPVLVLKKL